MLELSVLGSVDERVDDAVAKHKYIAEMVIPRSKEDGLAEEADCSCSSHGGETDEESTAYHQ